MRTIYNSFILTVLILLFNISSTWGSSLFIPQHTPQPRLELQSGTFGSSASYKTAGVAWLPDWQWESRGFSNNTQDDKGGGDTDKIGRCGTYGMVEACGSPKVSTGTVKPVVGLVCQKACICPQSYLYDENNCKGNYEFSGTPCDGKYNGCTCKPEFKYNASNCSGDYKVSGTACEGKYNSCVGKTCAEGGYYDKVQPERKCSNVTYGGKVCQSCYQPQCSEGGYEASSKTGYICTVKAYYGRTCYSCTVDPCYNLTDKAPCTYGCQTSYSQCKSKCQSCYSDNCRNRADNKTDYGCTKYWPDCPAKCEIGKTCSNACDNGFSLTACNSSQIQVSTKVNDCKNICYQCRAKTDTCSSGTKAPCTSSQVQTGTSITETGSICYICRNKTCSDFPGYSSSLSGEKVYEIVDINLDLGCYRQIKVGDIYYSDNSFAGDIVVGKTPAGVVGDVARTPRLLVALEEAEKSWSSEYYDLTCIDNIAWDSGTNSGTNQPAAQNAMDGKENTACIVSTMNSNRTEYDAGMYCANYTYGGVGGWFLPSSGEAYKTMFLNKDVINETLSMLNMTKIDTNRNNSWYWSSTEYGNDPERSVWALRPFDGNQINYTDKGDTYRVRCVRDF